jgi:hypothetical protein
MGWIVYKKGQDPKKKKPTRYKFLLGGNLHIDIIWDHEEHPNEWSMNFQPFLMHKKLNVYSYEKIQDAKALAVAFAYGRLRSAIDILVKNLK